MSDAPVPPTRTAVSSENPPRCCHWCGYQLTGLPESGTCPECGTRYSPQTVRSYEPWPNAFQICMRVGWPVILWFVLALLLYILSADPDSSAILMFCAGWLLALAAIVNGYFQVRTLLRRSMPDRTRTKGPVAVFRAIGTAACVVLGIVLLLPPVACAACIIMFL